MNSDSQHIHSCLSGCLRCVFLSISTHPCEDTEETHVISPWQACRTELIEKLHVPSDQAMFIEFRRIFLNVPDVPPFSPMHLLKPVV